MRPRVLILSATPYKAVTFDHEKEDHYRDFQRTLSFLLGGRSDKKDWLDEVNNLLLDFKGKLTGNTAELPVLIDVKDRLENRLKEVMCRTERNRYMLDEQKGVEDHPDLSGEARLPVPMSEALSEFVSLRSFLQKHDKEERPFPSIMDFWKSCSSVITFMDSGYVLIRNLKKEKIRIDSKLLRPESELDGLSGKNLKMQTLVLGIRKPCQLNGVDARRWRFLWTRPTYVYHRDEFFLDAEPTKFLVFSRWRFVPKAISFGISSEFEPTLRRRRKELTQALELNSESLKVCMPFVFLADLVDPAGWAAEQHTGVGTGSGHSSAELRSHVRRRLKAQFEAAKIPIVKKGRRRLFWPSLFELERRHLDNLVDVSPKPPSKLPQKSAPDLYDVLEEAVKPEDPRNGDSTQAKSFLRIVAPWTEVHKGELAFPKELLEEVVTMTLSSPAVCLLRAIRSLFRTGIKELLPPVTRACFQELRTYFNKGYVQEIIGRHTRSGRYADQVLRYCFRCAFPVGDRRVFLSRPARSATH